MNTIEASPQDSEAQWDNFTFTRNKQLEALGINGLAAVVVMANYCALPFPIFVVSGVAFGILFLTNASLIQNHDFFKNRKVQLIGHFTAIVITVLALFHLKILAVLPMLQGACHYFAYLRLEGLTKEKRHEILMKTLKEMIRSKEEPSSNLQSFFGILINEVEDYEQFFFRMYRFSDKDFQDLLVSAYNTKIIGIGPKSLNYLSSWNESMYHKRFEMSVDYLINCKKNFSHLDEKFINNQLKHMVCGWHTGFSASTWGPFGDYLSLVDGIPTIKNIDFRGDISALKQKLIEAFGTIVEVN